MTQRLSVTSRNNMVAVGRPMLTWCRMSNYRSRNSHIQRLLQTSDCFSERDGQMPASSVGAEHMVCLQIKTGTRKDEKTPSASDSAGVYHHRLALGMSTTLWWFPGPTVFVWVYKRVEIHLKLHVCISPSLQTKTKTYSKHQSLSDNIWHMAPFNTNLENRVLLWRKVVHEILRLHSRRVLENQDRRRKWFLQSNDLFSLKRKKEYRQLSGQC